jgi:TonB family protein
MTRIAILTLVLLGMSCCVMAQHTTNSNPPKEPKKDKPVQQSNIDILSDTQGVDFDPYLKKVVEAVKTKWFAEVPEIARPPQNKKGMVAIEFVITKNGRIGGMKLSGPSGDISLDRAAWGGITASNPFPPLPTEFKGDYLALRFRFYYNPEPAKVK